MHTNNQFEYSIVQQIVASNYVNTIKSKIIEHNGTKETLVNKRV